MAPYYSPYNNPYRVNNASIRNMFNTQQTAFTPEQIALMNNPTLGSSFKTSSFDPNLLSGYTPSSAGTGSTAGAKTFRMKGGAKSAGTAAGAATVGATTAGAAKGKWNILSPNLKSKFGTFTGNLMNPNFDYNMNTGLTGWGRNLGTWMNYANLASQGINAIQNLDSLSDTTSATDDIISDIVIAASNSPTLAYDLTPDQLQLLRELQRGTYSTDTSLGDVSMSGVLGDALQGGLMGIGGGLPGIAIGAIGGAINSGLGDMQGAAAKRNAELEALYAALSNSQQNYNAILRDRAYARL